MYEIHLNFNDYNINSIIFLVLHLFSNEKIVSYGNTALKAVKISNAGGIDLWQWHLFHGTQFVVDNFFLNLTSEDNFIAERCNAGTDHGTNPVYPMQTEIIVPQGGTERASGIHAGTGEGTLGIKFD